MKIALSALGCILVLASVPQTLHGQAASLPVAVDTFTTPHFRIVYDRIVPRENVKSIADEIELICGEFNEKAAFWLSNPVVVAVVPSFQGLAARYQRKVESPVFYSHDTLVIVSWHDAGYQRERAIPSLRYTVAYSVLEKTSSYGTPRWLMYGYALRFSHLDMKLTPPLVAYMRSFDDFGEEEQQYYDPSQAGDYNFMLLKTIDFLVQRYGEQKFVSLFSIMRMDKTLTEGFETAFGEKYTTIEKAWRAYIDTQIGGPKSKKVEPAVQQGK